MEVVEPEAKELAPEAGVSKPAVRMGWAKRLRRAAVITTGALVSAGLIATVFLRTERVEGALRLTPRFALEDFTRQLGANLGWVAAFAALTALVLPLRAIQWRHALGTRSVAFGHRYHALAIGAFLHNALPGKLGELGRALVLARRQQLPFFECFGSVLACKLLEFAALVGTVGFALALPFGRTEVGRLSQTLPVAGVVLVALAAVAVLLARYARRTAAGSLRRGRVRQALAQVGGVFEALGSPARIAAALVASFAPILAAVFAYGIALRGVGVEGGLLSGALSGALVLGAIAFGQLLPGLPVGIGMYYLTSSWAARALGAGDAEAASFAMLTHLATSGTQLLVGLVSVLVYRIRPRELFGRPSHAAVAGERPGRGGLDPVGWQRAGAQSP